MAEDSFWLIELAEAKVDGTLPRLAKFTLTECTSNKWMFHGLVLLSTGWNTPEVVKKAFDDPALNFPQMFELLILMLSAITQICGHMAFMK
jgi:hypothetical protein